MLRNEYPITFFSKRNIDNQLLVSSVTCFHSSNVTPPVGYCLLNQVRSFTFVQLVQVRLHWLLQILKWRLRSSFRSLDILKLGVQWWSVWQTISFSSMSARFVRTSQSSTVIPAWFWNGTWTWRIGQGWNMPHNLLECFVTGFDLKTITPLFLLWTIIIHFR